LRLQHLILSFVAWSMSGLSTAYAQKVTPSTDAYYAPTQMPPAFHENFKVLGDRLQKPGNERVALGGTLTDSNGTVLVQIFIENGGKLRLDSPGNASRGLSFNGTSATSASGKPSSTDDDLLESLVDDHPDTLMRAVATGTGFRLLGRRFPDGSGFCDYYDVPTPAKANSKQPRQSKRYCFDSATLLLRSVQYSAGTAAGGAILKTEFGDWRNINGQAVPSRVVRMQNSTVLFTFQAQSVTVSPKLTDNLFGP